MVTVSCQELLDRMIAKAPEARYQTAGEMVTAIRESRNRRQKNTPSMPLTGVIRQVRGTRVLTQVQKLSQKVPLTIGGALKNARSRQHLLTACSSAKRRLVENFPTNPRQSVRSFMS